MHETSQNNTVKEHKQWGHFFLCIRLKKNNDQAKERRKAGEQGIGYAMPKEQVDRGERGERK